MAIWKLATSVAVDGLLPRDRMMINPVINDTLGGGDIEQLCVDWNGALTNHFAWNPSGPEVMVKAYDVTKHPHGPPAAVSVVRTGQSLTSAVPREIALCLSFYSEYNAKRRRGRLYIPMCWMTGTTTPMAARPGSTFMDFVMGLGEKLEDLGGVDDDWSIWSPSDNVARKVTNYWCDNEWDIQRPRGRRGTTRVTATTSE